MKMKNYILIGLVFVAVIAIGYFVYQNVQRPQTVDILQTDLIQKTEIKITDSLLTKDKEICSPYSDDGTPYCNELGAVDEKTLKYRYPDENYDFIRKMKCPPDYIDSPEKITIHDTLSDTIPPSGKSRVAYYCSSLNQFWVSEYDSEKVPMGYWYGPFEGYPVK